MTHSMDLGERETEIIFCFLIYISPIVFSLTNVSKVIMSVVKIVTVIHSVSFNFSISFNSYNSCIT